MFSFSKETIPLYTSVGESFSELYVSKKEILVCRKRFSMKTVGIILFQQKPLRLKKIENINLCH